MKETIESIFFVIAVIVFVVVIPLLGLGRLRRARNKKLAEDYAIAEERYNRSLRHPDYAAFEAHYGCPPPMSLRQPYEDAKSNLDGNFDVRFPGRPKSFFIAYFEPMDKENMSIAWPGTEELFPFANDGCGNQYLINPREADPKVYFYDHELKERESLDVSLSQFLAAKRTQVADE